MGLPGGPLLGCTLAATHPAVTPTPGQGPKGTSPSLPDTARKPASNRQHDALATHRQMQVATAHQADHLDRGSPTVPGRRILAHMPVLSLGSPLDQGIPHNQASRANNGNGSVD